MFSPRFFKIMYTFKYNLFIYFPYSSHEEQDELCTALEFSEIACCIDSSYSFHEEQLTSCTQVILFQCVLACCIDSSYSFHEEQLTSCIQVDIFRMVSFSLILSRILHILFTKNRMFRVQPLKSLMHVISWL